METKGPLDKWREFTVAVILPMMFLLLGVIGWLGKDLIMEGRLEGRTQRTRIEDKVDLNNHNIINHINDPTVHAAAINPIVERINGITRDIDKLWARVFRDRAKNEI